MYKSIATFLALCTTVCMPVTQDARLRGCMFSAMLGDCLGRVTEFKKDLKTIFACYPNGVTHYTDFRDEDWAGLPAVFHENKIMPYTDDSRMAILVLRSLSRPVKYSQQEFCDSIIFCAPSLSDCATYLAYLCIEDKKDQLFGWAAPYRAPGNACLKGVQKLEQLLERLRFNSTELCIDSYDHICTFIKNNGWDIKATEAGGCGSVMRAYPCGMVFSDNPEAAIDYAVAQSKLTHGAPLALASCAGIAAGTAAAIRGESVEKIVDAIIAAAEQYDAIAADKVRNAYTLALKNRSSLTKYGSVMEAFKNNDFRTEHERIFNLFPGWAAHDALAGAVYCFVMSSESILNALYLGVHTPGDSDSIASLAGALVGAHCGDEEIWPYIRHIEDADRVGALLVMVTDKEIVTIDELEKSQTKNR